MNLEFRLRFHQERVRTRWDGGGRGGGGDWVGHKIV